MPPVGISTHFFEVRMTTGVMRAKPRQPSAVRTCSQQNIISKMLTRRFLRPDRPAPGEDAAPKTSSSDLSKHLQEDGILTVGRLCVNSSRNKTGMQPANHKNPF